MMARNEQRRWIDTQFVPASQAKLAVWVHGGYNFDYDTAEDRIRHAKCSLTTLPVIGLAVQHKYDPDSHLPSDSRMTLVVRDEHEIVALDDAYDMSNFFGVYASLDEVDVDERDCAYQEWRDDQLHELELQKMRRELAQKSVKAS